MVTGELKNRIDSLWEIFWTGGLTNPLDVIEQITYLMFIRDLDDSDNLRAKESAMLGLPYKSVFVDEVTIGERKIDGNQLKWSVFRDFPAGKMYSVVQEWVFPFIKDLHGDKNSAYSKYMSDAIFKLPTPLMLDKVVNSLDEIYRLMNETQSSDVRGDVYEYLLAKIATAGVNGQFRTPRHIIKMMVELMDPKADDVICDPACGTSGFLVAAGEYLKEHRKEEIFYSKVKKDHYMNHMFHGYDMDRTMLRIGAMNMMTHGIDNPFIEYRDSLSDQNPDKDKYSLILANPPFKGSLDADIVSTDLLKVCKTKKTELLFLALFLRMLRVGGRCACIVPDGVLFGSSTAHKAIRKALIEENRLEAVISMPSGVFKPYAGVSTGILIFTKTGHGGTDKVWFYDMQADGFSLDDKRSPVTENDIPDIIARFRSIQNLPLEGKVAAKPTDEVEYNELDRKRTEKSFFVPKDEIVGNDYDLSINKYKQTEYKPVEYPPTSEIMAELRKIEDEIKTAMDELEEMLK
ncbi:MAG: SAM-dependent DNA methyltransferase [Clostridia bacterium]|nr:SAM-dependent DNA methyltransferase [Clostridia bacterium]